MEKILSYAVMKRIFESYVGKERQGKITDKIRNQQKEIDSYYFTG